MSATSCAERMTRGSPPRARGHVVRILEWELRDRFTPACAGTCDVGFVLHDVSPVHPRVRGDMESTCAIADLIVGSPPRARGHVLVRQWLHGGLRFTPACAGTCSLSGPGCTNASGSPPRARGHGGVDEDLRLLDRFTPACAGTCVVCTSRQTTTSVHPRVRGDMRQNSERCPGSRGSPPRARGHGGRSARHQKRARFTPACAGTWNQRARSLI